MIQRTGHLGDDYDDVKLLYKGMKMVGEKWKNMLSQTAQQDMFKCKHACLKRQSGDVCQLKPKKLKYRDLKCAGECNQK